MFAVKKQRATRGRAPASRAEKADRPAVIGERVRELYEARGWSQLELAWRANLSLPKVNNVICERQGLGCAALVRLALALGTSTDYLVGLTDDKLPRSR